MDPTNHEDAPAGRPASFPPREPDRLFRHPLRGIPLAFLVSWTCSSLMLNGCAGFSWRILKGGLDAVCTIERTASGFAEQLAPLLTPDAGTDGGQ